MRLAKKEPASGVMVNVTGWGAAKVSARGIDSLSERCGKQMGLNNSEFSRSPERDSKISWERAFPYRKSNRTVFSIQQKKNRYPPRPICNDTKLRCGCIKGIISRCAIVKLLHPWTSLSVPPFSKTATFAAYPPLIPRC